MIESSDFKSKNLFDESSWFQNELSNSRSRATDSLSTTIEKNKKQTKTKKSGKVFSFWSSKLCKQFHSMQLQQLQQVLQRQQQQVLQIQQQQQQQVLQIQQQQQQQVLQLQQQQQQRLIRRQPLWNPTTTLPDNRYPSSTTSTSGFFPPRKIRLPIFRSFVTQSWGSPVIGRVCRRGWDTEEQRES